MEAYQKFLDFAWSDERWQEYLNGLYPPPNHKQILKYKKKWYKKTIEPDFDMDFEPEASSCSSGGGAAASPQPASAAYAGGSADAHRWATTRWFKKTLCLLAYITALSTVVPAILGVFPTSSTLLLFMASFLMEVFAKYGLRLKTEWLQSALLDDVGVMPLMLLALLPPGQHAAVQIISLSPPVLTAMLAFSVLCKAHPVLPGFVRNMLEPLTGINMRYQVMQVRADTEVVLAFSLLGFALAGAGSLISVLLFWNYLTLRYMMSAWTQASFRKVDGMLEPVLGKIPGIKQGYAALKRGLYNFVDPARKGGSMCSVL